MAQLADIAAWLRDIDDGYLEAWANRGLLRRGRKLLDQIDAETLVVDEQHCSAKLDSHNQRLEAPGFDQLSCSCPALKACHHLVAFLLALKQLPALSEQADSTSEGNAATEDRTKPWLAEPFAPIEKQLGASQLKRAKRLLLQAVEVALEEGAGGLVANINDGDLNTVRIPSAGGLDGSICTCRADRCVHRALAVLSSRIKVGLYDLSGELDDALTPAQLDVTSQLQNWLRELVGQGTAGVSNAMVDQGEALATVTKQADFPALAASLSGLVKLMRDELAGRSFISASDFRGRLAPLWSRLNALQANPLPQPLTSLAGQHKRHYKLVQNLDLLGVGAEAWRSAGGYLGLTLHLFAPKTGQWYRQTQVRRADQITDQWSPENCWKSGVWCSGLPCNKVPGAQLALSKGWASGDGQLSARDGTKVTLDVVETTADALPVELRFERIKQHYAQLVATDPLAAFPSMPVLLRVHRSDKPAFDSVEQRWYQIVEDDQRQQLQLEITLTNSYAERAKSRVENLWDKKKGWQYVFGFVARRDGELTMRPVSLRSQGDKQWTHLTLS